jgi:hypothetical protein
LLDFAKSACLARVAKTRVQQSVAKTEIDRRKPGEIGTTVVEPLERIIDISGS